MLRIILAIAKERSPKCSIAMKNRNHCDGNSMDWSIVQQEILQIRLNSDSRKANR